MMGYKADQYSRRSIGKKKQKTDIQYETMMKLWGREITKNKTHFMRHTSGK